MQIILFTIAIILFAVLLPISIAFVFISEIFHALVFFWERVLMFFEKLAVSIDMVGNVMLAPIMNKVAGNGFGGYGKTISYILGKNEHEKTLKPFGKFLCWFLDKLDKNHCIKTYKNMV